MCEREISLSTNAKTWQVIVWLTFSSLKVRSGWSIAKYSKWLDENSEVEAWKLMKASLDAYAQKVNSRGDSAFHPIYPIMLSLANYFFERLDTTTTTTTINA